MNRLRLETKTIALDWLGNVFGSPSFLIFSVPSAVKLYTLHFRNTSEMRFLQRVTDSRIEDLKPRAFCVGQTSFFEFE